MGHLLGQQISVNAGVHGHEGLTKAGRERGLRFFHANFRTGHFGGVARDEMVSRLRGRESRDGRQHAKGIARQENDVLRVATLGVLRAIIDEFNGIGASGVLCL